MDTDRAIAREMLRLLHSENGLQRRLERMQEHELIKWEKNHSRCVSFPQLTAEVLRITVGYKKIRF